MKHTPKEVDIAEPQVGDRKYPWDAYNIPITITVAVGPAVPNNGAQQTGRIPALDSSIPSIDFGRIYISVVESMRAFTKTVVPIVNVFKPAGGTLVQDNTLLYGGVPMPPQTIVSGATDTHLDVGLIQGGLPTGTYYVTVAILITAINGADIYAGAVPVNLTFTQP